MPLEKLDSKEIRALITTISGKQLDIKILIKDSLPSTNDFALEQIANNQLQPKTAVLAEKQTAGKGRQGRTWISPSGNICLSLYWQFNCDLMGLYGLSLAVGVAIARVLKTNGLVDVKLKWPNDIYWCNRKMGGILIETKQAPVGGLDVVIGIGLNVQSMDNYQQQIDQHVCALEDALQHKVHRNKLVAQLLIELTAVLDQFAALGFDAFIKEWKQYENA